MPAKMQTFKTREEWLAARRTIGGSEAAATMGKSPHMSNLDLWKLKTGRMEPADLSKNHLVQYGIRAEEHLRELFALDFPEYKVMYEPNNLWTNDKYPHAHASLDGWLYDYAGRIGILEIKTATIQRAGQADLWDGRLPDDYFIQLLHNMAVLEADFAILVAQQKWERGMDVLKVTKHYTVNRAGRETDIGLLMLKEGEFWTFVTSDLQPPLILPELRRR